MIHVGCSFVSFHACGIDHTSSHLEQSLFEIRRPGLLKFEKLRCRVTVAKLCHIRPTMTGQFFIGPRPLASLEEGETGSFRCLIVGISSMICPQVFPFVVTINQDEGR